MSQIGGVQSAASIKGDYLKLLVTQLSNQNPLDPMDNQDMAAQLAQLSQLEQIEGIRQSFDQVLADQQRVEAASLIGKQVTFYAEGVAEPISGEVESVDLSAGGVKLRVGEWVVSLEAIQEIRE